MIVTAADHTHMKAICRTCGDERQAYYVTDRTDIAVGVLQRAIAQLRDTDAQLAFSPESERALARVMDDRTARAALQALESLSGRIGELAEPHASLLAPLANVAMRRQHPADAQRLVDRALAGPRYPPPLAC